MSETERGTKQTFSEQEVLRLARAAYSENASFVVRPEKSALLVIDMQVEFAKPHWTPFCVPEATRRVKLVRRLINHCRSRRYQSYSPPSQTHTPTLTDRRLVASCRTDTKARSRMIHPISEKARFGTSFRLATTRSSFTNHLTERSTIRRWRAS